MNIINLNKKRAEKKQDCREWTALDCLEDTINAIKNGEFKAKQIIIHMLEEKEDGGSKHHFACAGVTFSEHIALLELAKSRTLEEWRE